MYKKAAILFAQGVQDEEFIYPYYRLQEEGFEVHTLFVGTEKYNLPQGKYGITFPVTKEFGKSLQTGEFIAKDIDILIIPGGWQCPEILRMNEAVLDLVRRCHLKKKIIGAICHGPQVLISAKIGKGKKITAFPGILDDLFNFGVISGENAVVVDENLVTAQHYRNNPEFMKAVLDTYFNWYVPKHYQA